jgi:hypothetical protein
MHFAGPRLAIDAAEAMKSGIRKKAGSKVKLRKSA